MEIWVVKQTAHLFKLTFLNNYIQEKHSSQNLPNFLSKDKHIKKWPVIAIQLMTPLIYEGLEKYIWALEPSWSAMSASPYFILNK